MNGGSSPVPGDRLVLVGGVLFVVGAVSCVATVAPLLLGADRLPLVAYLVTLLAPLGFGLALAGVLVSARARRRRS
ncbi:hypothetical protein [Motilibacter aurantiacus]|uniref:hypothetical protein n=1 Tax=Motilibacter aurantiacus TaxID=2714955 RepID=UPI00140DA8F3|nr:hypothetical protein [Motilibacter aurantiacus]NHC46890.1 hypothetical protein [Motilibacter aurantiacus]